MNAVKPVSAPAQDARAAQSSRREVADKKEAQKSERDDKAKEAQQEQNDDRKALAEA